MGMVTVFKSEVADILRALALKLGHHDITSQYREGYRAALRDVATALGIEMPRR